MSLTPVYELRASECPALMVATGNLDLSAASPAPQLLSPIVVGDKEALLTKTNAGLVAIEAAGRFPTGAAAVSSGCDLEPSGEGLAGGMSPGYVSLDVTLCFSSALEEGFPNDTRVFAWIQQSGDLYLGADQDDTPGVLAAFLGSVVTSGGKWRTVDYSGRWTFARGSGLLYRRTADAGEPDDTPSATERHLTRTAGGLYLWEGDRYTQLDDTTTSLSDALSTLEAELAAQGRLLRRVLWHLSHSPLGPQLLDPETRPHLIRAAAEAR